MSKEPFKVVVQPNLYVNIKSLAESMSEEHQVFFSEDGTTALILSEKDGNTFLVKLSREEYATAGGKMFWVSEKLDTEPEQS